MKHNKQHQGKQDVEAKQVQVKHDDHAHKPVVHVEPDHSQASSPEKLETQGREIKIGQVAYLKEGTDGQGYSVMGFDGDKASIYWRDKEGKEFNDKIPITLLSPDRK